MSDYDLDDFRTEVDEHGNIKVTSYVEAVVISKEEQEQMQRIFKQLQEENDKLRKLISDMWRFTGAACKKYPKLFDPAAQGGQMMQLNHIDSFEQRMSELGIEVEDV